MKTKSIDIESYLNKINQVEIMLNEIKEGLLTQDIELQESIQKGEKDIKEGRVTICKNQEDLDNFFESI